MARKHKKRSQRKPATMCWEFDPDIPTRDFFEEGPLDDPAKLDQAVYDFVSYVEDGEFLAWEAVVCDERGLPLTAGHQEALRGLFSFNDDCDDEILSIDGIPRPSEPWYVILNKIVPYLLIEPLKTFDVHEDVQCDGWRRIMKALKEHGEDLSLPPGVASYSQVVSADLQHRLWLQDCFNDLNGLGQEQDMTLADPKEHYRIDWFIKHLREDKESVAHFGLTLESLLTRVILPDADQPIFLQMMQDKLGLGSTQEPIAEHL